LVLFELLGLVFSVVTLSSCNFMQYEQRTGNVPLASIIPTGELADVVDYYGGGNGSSSSSSSTFDYNATANLTSAGFGLLQWSPNNWGCTDYSNKGGMGTAFSTAQVGGLLASIFGLIALFFHATELVCCRFVCAKVLGCLALLIAVIGQSLTFVLYASDVCLHRGNVVYACDFGQGCAWSILAFCFYLLSTLLVCPAPKPQPLCKAVCEKASSAGRQQQKQQDVSDPCCYCFRYKRDGAAPPSEDSDAKKQQNDGNQLESGNNRAAADSGQDGGASSSAYGDTVPDLPEGSQHHGYGYPQEVYAARGSSRSLAPPPLTPSGPLSSSATAASAPPSAYYGYPPPSQYPPPSPYYYYYYFPPPQTHDPALSFVTAAEGGRRGGPTTAPTSQLYSLYPSGTASAPLPPFSPTLPPMPTEAPPIPTPPPGRSQEMEEQYHYYTDPSSFANGEVTDGDLFFDSKTV
jgi:hypothetical protein